MRFQQGTLSITVRCRYTLIYIDFIFKKDSTPAKNNPMNEL